MCGLNGIFSIYKVANLQERIEKMNNSISHRGPDAEGVNIISSKLGFGHRRLSIIDLDQRANQPMVSNSGNTTIVFNGEIFNFRFLKKQLVSDYDFRTESDTEVLLAAYEIKGIDWLLKNINGMFAFALFNKNDNSIILARDRFGIKPLFYTINDGVFVFSSEIKAILSAGFFNPKFNVKAIDDYLANRYVREPNTFFENIYSIDSASYILVSSDLKIIKKQYWQLPGLNFDTSFNEKEIIEQTKTEVENAVKRWLISDVRVGAYLSGGLDSSLTTAIIALNTDKKVDTYTIGFADERFNEFKYSKIVAAKYDTAHREFLLNQKDYFDEWIRLIWYKDAPLGVPNEIPLSIMTSRLSKDITVVISGEGADELFGGYGRIFRSAFDYSNSGKATSFYNYFIDQYEYVPRKLRDQYLKNINLNYRNDFDRSISSEFDNFRNEENIFRFFHSYHIKGLLNRVDMNTMQASIEGRPPFLDHELIEFVYKNVPYDLKLKWKDGSSKAKASNRLAQNYSENLDIPKYALKKVSEYYLPEEIIYRKKMGFPVPLTNWFNNLNELAKDVLSDTDWLNSVMLNNLIEDLMLNKNDRTGQLLWMFINVELFKREYFGKTWKY